MQVVLLVHPPDSVCTTPRVVLATYLWSVAIRGEGFQALEC
jgi:hypothetical protein